MVERIPRRMLPRPAYYPCSKPSFHTLMTRWTSHQIRHRVGRAAQGNFKDSPMMARIHVGTC